MKCTVSVLNLEVGAVVQIPKGADISRIQISNNIYVIAEPTIIYIFTIIITIIIILPEIHIIHQDLT